MTEVRYIEKFPDDLNALRRSVKWAEYSQRQLNCAREKSLYVITVMDGDKEIGIARVVGDGGYQVLISDVIILPEYQGKGLGKALVTKVLEYMRQLHRRWRNNNDKPHVRKGQRGIL